MAQVDALPWRCDFAHSEIFVRRLRRSHPLYFSQDCPSLPANGLAYHGVPEVLHSMVLPHRLLPVLILLQLQLRDVEAPNHARRELLRGLARPIEHSGEINEEGEHRGV